MGGSRDGAGNAARLYRLDLEDDTAFPERLVFAAGEQLFALQAGPAGRVYFLQGLSTRTLRYVDGDQPRTVAMSLPFAPVSLAVKSDGSLFVAGLGQGQKLAAVTISPSDVATVTVHNVALTAGRLRADNNGGYYGDVELGLLGSSTALLLHVPAPGAPHKIVHETPYITGGFKVAYDMIGESGEVLVLTPGMTDTITSVALPVPLATM